MSCLPCKEIIDNGMGANAGKFYGRVLSHVAGLRPVDYEMPLFYADAVADFSKVAQRMLGMKLDKDQSESLMAQIDKSCYRAEDFENWSHKTEAEIVEHAADWTAEILSWIKDDQEFYTALSAEVK